MDRDSVDKLDRARGAFAAYEEPNRLPDPIPDLGYSYRWIATVIGGQPQVENVAMMFRAGWAPVLQEEQPHILMLTEGRSQWVRSGCIEIGGLLLCKQPEQEASKRVRHYETLVEKRLTSFKDTIFNMSRREMPISGEWRSYTEDGREPRGR